MLNIGAITSVPSFAQSDQLMFTNSTQLQRVAHPFIYPFYLTSNPSSESAFQHVYQVHRLPGTGARFQAESSAEPVANSEGTGLTL